jgi:glycosyltransferase involved in cell wall biosynthesis
MKDVFIISTGDIVRGRMAGTQRVLKTAKSLAAGNITVYLCSLIYINNDLIKTLELFPGIYSLESTDKSDNNSEHLTIFLRAVNKFMKDKNSDKVIYLYPTTWVLKDFIYLLYFKVIKGYNFYCDINELRSTNVFSTTPPAGFFSKIVFFLKSVRDLISYKLSELQIPFYDGIVVISTSLEKYFSKYTKKIIRVPILCDVSEIKTGNPPVQFNSGVFKICFTGTISCSKEGFDILFEALSMVNREKKTELYLYGTVHDNDKEVIKKLIEINKLKERVFFMGNLDPDQLLSEFQKYHLLILPRPLIPQTKYGFSTKLSEYLISGIPVLVTDVSDNALYIKDSVNGYIVQPGSSEALADKILEIIENYNDNSPAIAQNSLQTALREFDYHLFTQTFVRFFFSD